jgi:MFS family permease
VWWAVAPLFLAGAANVYAEGAATAIMQDHTPDDLRAGILGVADTAMISAALVASLVGPWLADALGGMGSLALLAAVAAAACVLARSTVSVRDEAELSPLPETLPATG